MDAPTDILGGRGMREPPAAALAAALLAADWAATARTCGETGGMRSAAVLEAARGGVEPPPSPKSITTEALGGELPRERAVAEEEEEDEAATLAPVPLAESVAAD